MALSGSFYTYPVGSFGVYCSWSASQSIPGYYSDVTVNVYQHLTEDLRKMGTDILNGMFETQGIPTAEQYTA